jgi:hypothetical protein
MAHTTVMALDHHVIFLLVKIPALFDFASTLLFASVAEGKEVRLSLPEVQEASAKDAGVL